MYMLLEIADEYIIIFGIVVVIVLFVLGVLLLIFSKKNKVKPISESDRFEETSEIEFKKVEDLTDEQKKARAELERVFNQMNADLQKEAETVVDTFEREQEENAIISYQELIKQVKGVQGGSLESEPAIRTEIKENPIDLDVKEEFNIEDVMNEEEGLSFKEVKEPVKENYLDALENLKTNIKNEPEPERKPYSGTKTRFNNSEIISPIYGRQEPAIKTDNFDVDEAYSSLSRESEQKQNEEFLSNLKEFRNNL